MNANATDRWDFLVGKVDFSVKLSTEKDRIKEYVDVIIFKVNISDLCLGNIKIQERLNTWWRRVKEKKLAEMPMRN